MNTKKSLLTIGGFDPSGGAGITLDLQAGFALGVPTLPIITTMTFQSDAKFHRQNPFTEENLLQQFHCLNPQTIGVIKVGALGSLTNFQVLWPQLISFEIPIIIDPVFKTSSGGKLIEEESEKKIREFYLKTLAYRCQLITPNYEEACFLLSINPMEPKERIHPKELAKALQKELPCPILLKGGHAPDRKESLEDLLILEGEIYSFRHPYQPKKKIRGTGCALATAISSYLLSEGNDLKFACKKAINQLTAWIETAYEVEPGLFHLNIK